jgi:hypothetical protein
MTGLPIAETSYAPAAQGNAPWPSPLPPPAHSPRLPRTSAGPSPRIAIENAPPPRLIVDPPLPAPLAAGRVFIQYRTENMRVLPLFGAGALQASPRIGYIHITVDDASRHFVDASGETIIVLGLTPGPHKMLIELADPTHMVLDCEVVACAISETASAATSPRLE